MTVNCHEFLYRMLLKHAGFLGIIPEIDFNYKQLRKCTPVYSYTKIVGFCLFYTCLGISAIYFEANVMKSLEFNINIIILNCFMNALSFILVMLMLISSLKEKIWRRLMKSIDLMHKNHQNISKGTLWISICILEYLIMIYFAWIILEAMQGHFGIWIAICISMTNVCFLYQFIQTMVLNLINQEIRRMLHITFYHLDIRRLDIYLARRSYSNSLKAVRCFNQLFGHQIALNCAYCILLFESLCFNLAGKANPEKFPSKWYIDFDQLIMISTYVIFSSLNLFSVVISCDNTTSESLKLMDRCYELQEKFDRSTFEYQELQALAFYAAHNQLRFTAADLFEIRRSSMLALIATSTTYFIALVQFY
ncbi:uncharacterized protein LOC143194345 isoform X1 [Rhynchophorus ferrugineus]|uniref:uncharacterized protein LOC143194345 isoform X1 n=1 Tax=Rhynchophorus ferrugineus TaxID=354439 RepID=UPI003FCD9F16